MPIDALLLEMLACPSDDHAPLVEATHDGAPVLVCTFCRSSFPIEDDIPVLLLTKPLLAGTRPPDHERMSACAKSPPPRRGPREARCGARHAPRAERGGAAGATRSADK